MFRSQTASQNKIYIAPKPYQVMKQNGVLHRIFFLFILLWDATKLVFNKVLGSAISYRILPAQIPRRSLENLKLVLSTQIEKINASEDLTSKELTVITHDAARLDTLEIRPKNNKNAPSSAAYIITFRGNSMLYEDKIDDMVENARQLNCCVIGFNYRGVGKSIGQPRSANDLVTDGIAQVQRLLDAEVSSQQIVLHGHSLGSGVATLVAKHFHDQDIHINLFNGRSFSTITNVFVGKIHTARWLAKPLIKFALTATRWEIDAASAYKALQDANKEYIVVRSSKKDRCQDDSTIVHEASLHAAFAGERKVEKARIDAELKRVDPNRKYPMIDAVALCEQLISQRNHFKERKMVALVQGNAHNIGLTELTDRYQGRTANEFFKKFVERTNLEQQKTMTSMDKK